MSNNLTFFLTVTASLAIGAWLVISEHPWFGLLVFLIACCIRVTDSTTTTTFVKHDKDAAEKKKADAPHGNN